MRNIQRLSLFAAALVVSTVVAACARDLAAPDATAVVDPQPQLSLTDGSSYVARFVISGAKATTFTDGVNTLNFPAAAVCDPATSGYGPGTWDKPCAPLTTDLTVTVTATVANGRVNLDFAPDIRFNPARPVTLTVQNDAIKTAKNINLWTIFYRKGDGTVVDEGAIDSEVITKVDRTKGTATRRVKHFTGFNVTSGQVEDCTPYVDPYCVPVGSGGGAIEGY